MENYESLKNNESIKSDESLQKLIKEIDEIKDLTDSNDDKIDNVMKDGESVEGAESPSRVLDKGLSKSLMKCDENVLNTLINEVDNLLDSNPNVEGLSDLSKLLKEVKNNREKGNEDSFNKFKDIINKGKLSDLNSLKNEVQNIISFVNDDKNNITTLNLYANMVSLSPDAYKSFKSTDQKVYKDISDAIRNHFNMPEGAGVETAQKIQLEKIFDGMEDENVKKEDLQKLYEEYVGGEWNEEPIPEDGSVKFNKQVIVSSQDFAKKFNEINGSIPTENNDDVRKGTGELVNEGGEGDGGFEDVDIKEGLAVDEINKYVTDSGGKAIFRKKEQGEGTENKEGGYECNMENVKDFLKKIGNDIKFDKDFVAVKTPSRKAWLSSVQILFNKEHGGTLKVDGQYVRGGETYTAVKNFQEKYNESKKVDGKYPEGFEPLVEDGIPGPKTLSKLLGTSVDDNSSTGEDSSRIVDVDESLNRVSGTIEGVGKFEDGKFTFDDSVEQGDDEGGHYAIIGTEKYYESNGSMNGLGYFSGINPDNQGYFYIGNIKDGKCGGLGTMTWTSGEKYVGNWENNRRSGDGTLTFSNGNEYIGEFNDGSTTKGLLTLKSQDGAIMSFNVERDDSGLKITSGDNEGKYIDPKSRDITDTPSD